MSIVQWEPLGNFVTLRDAMDRLFQDSLVRPRMGGWLVPGDGDLALDMYETEDAVVVKTAVPGVKADDIDIAISGNILSISGETKVEEEIKEENYIRRERRYGSFSRSIALPEGVNPDESEASFEDGILTLNVPKAPDSKPKVIKVKSNKK